ncbi:MAG: cell division protein FtsQ/DivIB [Kiloniellaceae bacterium]
MRLVNIVARAAPWRAKTRRRRRRRVRRMWDWRLRRRAAAAALLAVALGGGGWLWLSGWFGRQATAAGHAVLAATARAGLKVDDVLVEGRDRTRRSAILEALGVARDAPILAFDPHAAKRRLEALRWVREATVERRLPDVVFVRLIEREPLALWQNRGRLAVIDRRGAVVPGARPEAFAQLPLLVGEDAPKYALDLIAMLESEPDLRSRVAAAVRVRGRRWNVRLEGGIDVRLPEDDPAAAWAQLARIQREHGILERDVVAIDLRTPDRLVVRTAPGVVPKRGRAGRGEDT